MNEKMKTKKNLKDELLQVGQDSVEKTSEVVDYVAHNPNDVTQSVGLLTGVANEIYESEIVQENKGICSCIGGSCCIILTIIASVISVAVIYGLVEVGLLAMCPFSSAIGCVIAAILLILSPVLLFVISAFLYYYAFKRWFVDKER